MDRNGRRRASLSWRAASGSEAQGKFLGDHLCRWAFGFARRLRARAGGTLYEGLSHLLASFLAGELRALGLESQEVAGPDVIEQPARASPAAVDDCLAGCEATCGFGRTL